MTLSLFLLLLTPDLARTLLPRLAQQIESRLQHGQLRAALMLVSTGEAALGIVYATDAHAEKGVKVVGTFPEGSHPPIIYPIAQTANSKDKNTAAFLKCVESAKASDLFKEQGFTVLAPSN